MPYSFVNYAGNSTPGGTVTQAYTVIGGAGSKIIVVVQGAATAIPTYSDTKTNLYGTPITVVDSTGASAILSGVLIDAPASGATTFQAVAAANTLNGIGVWEFAGLATGAALLDSTGRFASPGSVGANVMSSGNTGSVVGPAMVFGLSFDGNRNGGMTAGTSPLAFTQRSNTWSDGGNATGFNGSQGDVRVVGTGVVAYTAGNVSADQFDDLLALVMVVAETSGAPTIYTPFGGQAQFFVNDRVIHF